MTSDELFDLLDNGLVAPGLKPGLVEIDPKREERKKAVYQIMNHIIDSFDLSEKKDKKRNYTSDEVRKRVCSICMRSLL